MRTITPSNGKSNTQFQNTGEHLKLGEGERWFVARTQPHRENAACFNLERMGFRGFAPRFWRSIRHAHKIQNVLAPLFPGYIFVILDLSRDRWRSVNSTIGVASLIMGVDQPSAVPDGIVESLIARRENSGTICVDPDLKVGETVRILSGPFAETLCRIEHLDDRNRVRVLLDLMGGQVLARVSRSSISRSFEPSGAIEASRSRQAGSMSA